MNALEAYREVRDDPLDALVTEHAPLVRRIAHHLACRLPDCVQIEDLLQAGMIGLLDAARRYDSGHGAAFSTYAEVRVRGAMLDELRRGDWVPRSVHRRAREVAEAIRVVELNTGRPARDQEVAERLGISMEDYLVVLRDLAGQKLLSVEEMTDADGAGGLELKAETCDIFDEVARDRARTSLAAAIDELPERERQVLSLYYDEDLNLREIGAVLGVSESRVSQIRSQALLRLRSRFAE
jgi:RNA polymerase sigma factor for flagellar operon FliA